jgi:hypothetical protein
MVHMNGEACAASSSRLQIRKHLELEEGSFCEKKAHLSSSRLCSCICHSAVPKKLDVLHHLVTPTEQETRILASNYKPACMTD